MPPVPRLDALVVGETPGELAAGPILVVHDPGRRADVAAGGERGAGDGNGRQLPPGVEHRVSTAFPVGGVGDKAPAVDETGQ
jgi:hypothetical protein